MTVETTVNVKTGEVTRVQGPDPTPEEQLAAERARMDMSRAELVKAMGLAGILTTPSERIAFASGDIPSALRAMLDALPSEVAEDAEILLLTGSDYPRVSGFWDAAISAGQITATDLDDVYRAIAAAR